MPNSASKSLLTRLARTLALIPYPLLIGMSLFMLVAPIDPEPHLVQKLDWLLSGVAFKPVDVFDVVWHLLPSMLLLLRLFLPVKP